MLKVRCFAPVLAVTFNDQPISLTEQPALLLAYLVTHGHGPVSRMEIAELFWPKSPEAKQNEQLRNALRALKKGFSPASLQDYVRIYSSGYLEFEPDAPAFVDVLELERCARNPSATPSQLQEAAALYTGELLTFIGKRKTGRMARLVETAAEIEDDLDAWLERTHQRCKNAFDATLTRLVGHHARENNFAAVARWGREWQRFGQPTEEAYCEILVALHETNDLEGMERAYMRATSDYPVSLSIERSYRALKKPRIRQNLPALPAHFIGRHAALHTLAGYLSNPSIRLVTIYGMGGMGKSALALQAAHYAAQNLPRAFVDGIFWVSLEDCPNTQACAQAIIRAVSSHFSQNERNDPAQLLPGLLRDKNLLLLLDDVDTLVKTHRDTGENAATDGFRALIHSLYQTAQSIKILITSRAQINLDAEMPIFLGGLPFPLEGEEIDFQRHSSAELFSAAAIKCLGGRFNAPAQAPAIAEICRITEGLPLALRLAACQLPSHAGKCGDVAEAIAKSYRVLQTTARDVPHRHKSAYAVFESSWLLLDPSLQIVFAKLALFRNGFAPLAAKQVSGAADEDLSDLTRLALLEVDEDSGRFSLHPLLRQFCAEKLADLSEETGLRAKHAFVDYFAGLTKNAHSQTQLAAQLLADEWANALNAIFIASELENWPAVIGLTRFLADSWYIAGRYSDARQAYPVACAAAEKAKDGHAQVEFLAQWGRACVRQAAYTEAEAHFARGRELARKPVDALNIAQIEYEMAQLDIELGRAQTAHQRLDECLEIAEELNLHNLEGETHRQRARIYYNTHDTEKAEEFARRSVAIHEAHSSPALQLLALRMLGDVVRELWALNKKEEYRVEYESLWQQAMRLNVKSVQDRREDCSLRYSRLQFLRIRHEWESFDREVPECDRQLRLIGDRKTQIHLNTLCGYAFLEQERFSEAIERIEQSIQWLREMRSLDQTIHPLFQLSKAYEQIGRRGKALECLRTARDTAQHLHHPLLGKVEAALAVFAIP